MNAEKWKLLKCIAIPVVGGAVVGLLTSGSMSQFAALDKPPLSPPGWLFPIVWTILYTLMGIASYLIYNADASEQKNQALALYVVQLVVNLLWPVFFFVLQWYLFAFFWLIMLWVLIYRMIKEFWGISRLAAYLCIPYLVWVTFAGYLNLGIWWLNR